MKNKNPLYFLQDIECSLQKIFRYTKNISYEQFLSDDMIKDASAFLSKGKNKTVISSGDVSGVVLPIARILVAVASGVLVVVTAVLGVKYATTHDPNEQAKVKKQLIGLVVSIIVVFGGQAIWTIIYNVMKDF